MSRRGVPQRYLGVDVPDNASHDDNYIYRERDRSQSPGRQPSRTRYGNEAPAARYFASKPVRPYGQRDNDELDADIDVAVRRRLSMHDRDEYARSPVIARARRSHPMKPTLEEEEAHDDFATKVAAFKLPCLSLTQLTDMSGSNDEEREATSRPSRAINVYQSQYTGDGVMEGSHSANLTVRHDSPGPQGRSPCLFRWL